MENGAYEGHMTNRKVRGRKTKERRKQKRVGRSVCGGEKKKKKEKGFDSQCSDGQKLLVRELKLVYSTRATSRCQK